MPIYEYICEKCHEKVEIIQKMGENAPLSCPHCEAQGFMKKAVTSSAFHLKGGGWYKDLYASKKPGDDASQKPTKTNTPKSDKVEKKSNGD